MRNRADHIERGKIWYQVRHAPWPAIRATRCQPAKLRKSSANLPITNSEKAKTADNNGEENDENNSANEQMIRN